MLEPGPGRLVFAFQSFGESKDAIIVRNRAARREPPQAEHDGSLYLDGGAIMEFALDKVPVAINEMLQACGQTVENVSLFACHQANQLILRSLADELGVAREKVPFTAGKIGNESSASIPLVLSAVQEQTELTQVCCCGFGVGLAIGIAMADFSAVEFLGVDTL